jgi:hypothetical protein
VMWMLPELSHALRFGLTTMVIVSMMAPNSLYIVSQRTLYPNWIGRVCYFPALMCIGVGIAVSNSRAVVEALIGRESEFVRTPKRGDGVSSKQYQVKTPILPWIEIALGVYCAGSLVCYMAMSKVMLGPFLFIYAIGFLLTGVAGIRERLAANSYARRAEAPTAAIHSPANV